MTSISNEYTTVKQIPDYKTALDKFALHLRDEAERYVLTTHVNSDGDAIGSQLALYHVLRRNGKQVLMINPSPVPENMMFLRDADRIRVVDESRDAAEIRGADRIVVLDVNSPRRLPGLEPHIINSSAHKVVIDHHLDPTDFADDYLVNTDAVATSEILCDLFARMNVSLEEPEAAALYTAIMTDSGNFRFPRVDAALHRRIADLIEAGASPFEMYEQVYNQGSLERTRLLGRALAGIELYHAGRVGVMRVTAAMNGDNYPDGSMTEGFVNEILALRGVVIGALITERDGEIKLSIRSKGRRPINELAAMFDGGGHMNAAGGHVIGGAIDDVAADFVERSAAYVHERAASV